MNIFVLHKCPIKSAEMLWADDKRRAMKMIVESCQILSNVLYYNNIPTLYKKTHFFHPVCVWTRQSKKAFEWLIVHCSILLDIYKAVYQKEHKCDEVLDMICSEYENIKFPQDNFDNFCNCARNKSLELDFTHIQDVPTAYNEYLKARKNI